MDVTSDDTSPSPADLAALAVRLAERAAALALAGRAGLDAESGVATKSTATDLVTDVDRRVETWLRSELARLRPHDAVLGEEAGGTAGAAGIAGADGVRWLLDPIDGTVNFVLGLPQYGVSVAAEVAGHVVAGAVCAPALGETFWAARGGGAWLRQARDGDGGVTGREAGTALHGPRQVPLSRAVVATGFGYDAGLRARQVAAVAPLLPQLADIRRLGSAALDLCFLAAGRLDGYFEAGLNVWDHAAGGLVAREAGCVVQGPGGGPESGRLLVAAGPDLIGALAGALDRVGAADVL